MARQRTRTEPPVETTGAPELRSTVIKIYRNATVMKGGRRFSFSALVVVGDGAGHVGLGYGKANEVPQAVEKGEKEARKAVFEVSMVGTTLPHTLLARYKAARVLLKPAAPGTGVIAGAAVRAILEAAGVKDILTKAYGATNPKNLAKATIAGLQSLKNRQQVEALRGVKIA